MASSSKDIGPNKRRVTEELRCFQDRWTINYFFVEFKTKPISLICYNSVSVLKEYNIKRHYEAKHANKFDKYEGQFRQDQVNELKRKLSAQRQMFTRAAQERTCYVKASYAVAIILEKKSKPYSDGEIVKECLESVVEILCPEKKTDFSKISPSRQTITRRVDDIGKHIEDNLKNRASKLLDESTDLTDTAQVAIFIRGVDVHFNRTEELAALYPLKDTTCSRDLLGAVTSTLNRFSLQLNNLSGLTTDGAPAMVGKHEGLVKLIEIEAWKVDVSLITTLIWIELNHLSTQHIDHHAREGMNTLTAQAAPCVQSLPKLANTSISTTVTTVKPATSVGFAYTLIEKEKQQDEQQQRQRRPVSTLSDNRTSLNVGNINCESGVNFNRRSTSLNTLKLSSVYQPRMAQLETLEAKMASIEVSLSNSPRRKKLLNGTSNQLIIPTTNLNSSIRSIPKDLALRELDTLRNALRDKENIIQNLKGQLTIPGLRLQNLRKNNCNNSNGNLKELSEVEKKQAEERLPRLKNDTNTKRLAIKNLKIALEKLDITDNIDVRIQQAELEYQLGREELNLLTLLEETRTLHHLLEECNKKISDTHTLYNCLNSSDQVSIHAVEIIFYPKSPRFGAGQNDSNPGLYVDWALEDSGLVKGDRFVEVNGKIILTKSLDDLARLLSAAPDPALIVVLRHDKSGSCQVTSSSEYHQRELTTLRCELDEVRDRADEAQRTKDTLKTDNIRLTHRISYLEEQVSELISRLKYTESLETPDIRVVPQSPVITSTVKTTQNVTNINISSQPVSNCTNSSTNANNSGNKQPSQKTQSAVQFQKGSQINTLVASHPGLDSSRETLTNLPVRSRSSLSNVSNTHIGGNSCRNSPNDKGYGHSKHKSSRGSQFLGLQMSASSHDLDQRSHSTTKTHHHHNREKDYNSETNSVIDSYRNSQHCSRAGRQILENKHRERDYYNFCGNPGYKQDGTYTSGIQHSKSSPLLASSLLGRNNVMDQSYRKATRIVQDLTRNGITKDIHDKGERDYRDYRASRHNERNMELENGREHDMYREREREAVSHLYEKHANNGKYLTASEKYGSSDALRQQMHCNDGKKSTSMLEFRSEILIGRKYSTSESKSVEDLDSTDAPTPTPSNASSINPSITQRLFRKLHNARSVKSLDLDSDTSSYYNNHQQNSNKISQQKQNNIQSRVKQRLQSNSTNCTSEPISSEHTNMESKLSNGHLMDMIKPRPMPPKKPLRLSLHRAQSLQSVESAPPSTGGNPKQDKLDENGRKTVKRNHKGEGQVLTAIEQAEKYDLRPNSLMSTEVGNIDIVSRENMSNLKWTTFNQGRSRENIIYANETGHWC